MIYFYDGTRDAFLTAFVKAYDDADAVLASGNAQLSLGQESVFIRADGRTAERAAKRLCSFDKHAMHDLSTLLRSGESGRDGVAFAYFRLLAREKRPVRDMPEDAAIAADEILRRIGLEIHRFHGFLRFMESASGALYAPFAPDNDICDLVAPHFRARLKGYPFVIHDVPRKKAAVCDGEALFLAPLEQAEVVLSADEEAWQSLWKAYYGSVNIPSRARLKQMRGYMPVRYWKYLTEKQ